MFDPSVRLGDLDGAGPPLFSAAFPIPPRARSPFRQIPNVYVSVLIETRKAQLNTAET